MFHFWALISPKMSLLLSQKLTEGMSREPVIVITANSLQHSFSAQEVNLFFPKVTNDLVSTNLVDTPAHPHLAAQQHTSHGASPLPQVSRPLGPETLLSLVGLCGLTRWVWDLSSVFSLALLSSPELINCAQDQGLKTFPHFCRSSFLLSGFILSHDCVPITAGDSEIHLSAKASLTSDFWTHVTLTSVTIPHECLPAGCGCPKTELLISTVLSNKSSWQVPHLLSPHIHISKFDPFYLRSSASPATSLRSLPSLVSGF